MAHISGVVKHRKSSHCWDEWVAGLENSPWRGAIFRMNELQDEILKPWHIKEKGCVVSSHEGTDVSYLDSSTPSLPCTTVLSSRARPTCLRSPRKEML